MKYYIETNIDKSVIEQNLLISDECNKQIKYLARWVVDTREIQIREALIKLGWTPPSK